MSLLIPIFVILALISVPFTKWVVNAPGEDLEDMSLISKAILAIAGYLMWAYMLFPVWTAVVWAESIQSSNPPFDSWWALKGAILSISWLIVVGQLLYRSGYRDGIRGRIGS